MGNCFGCCSCNSCCFGARHLDSVETHSTGSNRPLNNVLGEDGDENEETVNVLGSSTSHSLHNHSPGITNEHITPSSNPNRPVAPEQLAIDLSQVSSEDLDMNDLHQQRERRESEEMMLPANNKPFLSSSNTVSTSQRKMMSSNSLQYSKSNLGSSSLDNQNNIKHNNNSVKSRTSNSNANIASSSGMIGGPNTITENDDGLFVSGEGFENSRDDFELRNNNHNNNNNQETNHHNNNNNNNLEGEEEEEEAGSTPLSPTTAAESVDDGDLMDSFYENRKSGPDIEDRIRFFSQMSASSTRSVKSENSEHESSKLNHFKKLGRATLVTDGANSLLSARGGRGSGAASRNRKTAVTMSAKPERQRDSYGTNKLSKEELAALAEAARNNNNNSDSSSSDKNSQNSRNTSSEHKDPSSNAVNHSNSGEGSIGRGSLTPPPASSSSQIASSLDTIHE